MPAEFTYIVLSAEQFRTIISLLFACTSLGACLGVLFFVDLLGWFERIHWSVRRRRRCARRRAALQARQASVHG